MVRFSICPRTGLKRGAWTAEEDSMLLAYITRSGHLNWREIPKNAGLSRCGKSCRLRWMNYLRPSIKRGNYTKDEDEVIVSLHQELGNKWSAIAESLPGRTDNEIKNYWHTHLSKRIKQQTKSKEPKRKQTSVERESIWKMQTLVVPTCVDTNLLRGLILESSALPISPATQSSGSSSSSESTSQVVTVENQVITMDDSHLLEFDEHFWTKPFMVEDSYTPRTSDESEISSDAGLQFDGSIWTEPFLLDDSEISKDEVLGFDGKFRTEPPPPLLQDSRSPLDDQSYPSTDIFFNYLDVARYT